MSAQTPGHLHASFLTAFNKNDLDGLLALYDPQATLVPEPGQTIQGRAAHRHVLQQFLAMEGTLPMTTAFTIQNGGLALLRGNGH